MISTFYGISTSIGSSSYNNYLNTLITAPLNTNKYPNVLPYHSYGILNGKRPTPPQFFSYQEPINSNMNTNMRAQYLRSTGFSNEQINIFNINGKKTSPNIYNLTSKRDFAQSTHTNYITPIPSSMYINIKKSKSIGKSSFKIGLPINSPISTKNYFASNVKSTLKRVRSGGTIAPKKKNI
jgi:hypothetical protein